MKTKPAKSFVFKDGYWRPDPEIKSWLPTLQSHRGFWVEGLQQNTISSIQKSFELGFKMVEFDVRITRDEELVLFHDEFYEGLSVEKQNFESLKDKLLQKEKKLDRFEDLLVWFKESISNSSRSDFKLNVEIKSRHPIKGTIDFKVVKLIEKYELTDSILISSFNPMSLYRVRKTNDRIRRALLLTESEESNPIANNMLLNPLCKPDVLHLRFQDFRPEKYAVLSRHVPIVLWTVNDLRIFDKNKDYVFGIISDSIKPDQFPKSV